MYRKRRLKNVYGLSEKQMAKCKDIYRDEDGYWAILADGYRLSGYFSEHIIHEDTLKEFRKAFRCIKEEK